MSRFLNKSLRSEKAIIFAFLVVLSVSFTLMFRSSRNQALYIGSLSSKFYRLQATRKNEGLQRFFDEKRNLRNSIREQLAGPMSDEQEAFANSVALYLFPDLLPDSNFEKEVGTEDWFTLEQAIESSPNTKEARAWFEELRANIWNYENPDKRNPQLSKAAREVLKIYSDLSLPEEKNP